MADVTLTLHIEPALCQGHNRCKKIAPELVELDDYGIARVVGDGLVPAASAQRARLAEANCPEFAITLTENKDGA